MNGNEFGHGEPDERDDAQSEPLPLRRPGQGRHTFSPLRFDSTPDAGSEEPTSGYGAASDGGNGYSGNGYGGHGYGGHGYATPPESGNAQAPPPGPYPSQLPGPYLSQPPGPYPSQGPNPGQYQGYDPGLAPGPYAGQRPYGRSMDHSSFDLRAVDTTGGGGSSSSVLSRYGYDPGEPTYGDSLYAQSRFNASDLEVRPGTGGRHAAPVGPGRPTTSRPTTSRPTTSRTTTSGPDSRRPRKRAAPAATEDRERRHMPLWQELPLLLVVAFCLAVLIRSFLLQAFFIPSSSMEATLLVGDRVLVNKVIYDLREPERGEIVVFRGTDKWAPENYVEPAGGVMSRIGRTLGDLVGVSRPGEKDFIKRVIGLPGDRVSCCDPEGRVYVNGVPINEPYINVNSSLDVPYSPGNCGSRRFDEVVIPAGQIFVMGDNRIVSQDARCQGPVPIANVIGRAFVIVWPSGRWDGLSVPDTFDSVPPPVALGNSPPLVGPSLVGPSLVASSLPTVGAAFVTLPFLATLVGSGPRFARRGQKRRWRPRRLRK